MQSVKAMQAVEGWLSTAFRQIAESSFALSVHLSATPISTQCISQYNAFSQLLSSLYHPLHPSIKSILFIFSITLSLALLVLLITFVANRIFCKQPYLASVPLPSTQYDPYDDIQSDLFIDEDVQPLLVSSDAPNAMEAINPATGDSLGYVRADSPVQVAEKVYRARKAQIPWAKTSFQQRITLLNVLKHYVVSEQKDLCLVSKMDTGKTLLEANMGEIITTLEKLRWVSTEGPQVLTNDLRSTGPMTIHKTAQVEYMPLGVIAAIAPWNYPMHNLFNPVISSLFAGNAIVIKPSELTAYSSLYFARIIRRAIALCGHSPDLVQLVIGDGAIGAALVESQIDKVFFTGSTNVGRMVAEAAAKKLLPAVLELGGKDPFIVCDDADLSHAVSICMRGVFQNAGQNCIGVERVFVQANVMQSFTEKVVSEAKKIRLGIDMGAMTMGERAIRDIQSLVDDAIENGADLLAGGKRAQVDGKGTYYQPTILRGVTPKMRIAREEVFGPVMSIFEWEGDAALVEMVNNCPFGLGSSLFSLDRRRADRIMSGLRVGMGNINDFGTNYLCQSMPFGGTKESGSDRFAGIEGLRGCCISKSVTRDRVSAVKTTLPKVFQYPTGANAFEFAAEINHLMYASGLLSKVDNLRQLAVMSIFPSWRPRSSGGW